MAARMGSTDCEDGRCRKHRADKTGCVAFIVIEDDDLTHHSAIDVSVKGNYHSLHSNRVFRVTISFHYVHDADALGNLWMVKYPCHK